MRIRRILTVWIMGYMAVTLVGIGHTCFNWLVLGMDSNNPAQGMYGLQAYAETVPWHVLYNLVLWPVFAAVCLRGVPHVKKMRAALKLGGLWALLSIGIDLVGWVAIPHLWRMTFTEFYIGYQPWITLIYLSILAAPLIAVVFLRWFTSAPNKTLRRGA